MSAYCGKYRDELVKNAAYMGTPGKGILAADETNSTIGERLGNIAVENIEENRRALRELMFCCHGALQYLSGVILFEETLYHKTNDGKPFVDVLTEGGVLPGIKVGKGTVELQISKQTATQGHDDLGKRCASYYEAGARFAKLHAILRIDGANEPSQPAIDLNAQGLSRFAIICQENGLVPLLEPEISAGGRHGIDRCAYIMEMFLAACYKALNEHHVLLEGTLLKTNMVTPGRSNSEKVAPEVIAEYTVRALQRTVPAAVPAIFFLSGGQSEQEATNNLNAMNKLNSIKTPWSLSFAFGRALQMSTMKAWAGKEENVEEARAAFLIRCNANSQATLGTYYSDAVP